MTKPGWQQNYWQDTADDPILEAILADQRGATEGTLKSAQARGQMSQGAYDYALGELGNKAIGARSQLEDLGLGVLGKYRTELGSTAQQFGDQITNYRLGQQVNPADLTGQLTGQKTGHKGRLQGDIYRALGDTELFNQ